MIVVLLLARKRKRCPSIDCAALATEENMEAATKQGAHRYGTEAAKETARTLTYCCQNEELADARCGSVRETYCRDDAETMRRKTQGPGYGQDPEADQEWEQNYAECCVSKELETYSCDGTERWKVSA